MNRFKKRKLKIALTLVVFLFTAGLLLLSLYAYLAMLEAEHDIEVSKLQKQLDISYELTRSYEHEIYQRDKQIVDLEAELEHINAAPIYDIPLDADLQQYTYDMCSYYQIPDKYEIVLALMWRESNFTADAVSATNDYGLMQINACNFTTEYTYDTMLDPRKNIEYGVYILASLYDEHFDDNMTLMAYNMGGGRAATHWSNGTYASNYSLDIIEKAKIIRSNCYESN